MVPIFLERWYLSSSPNQCAGCRYLAGVGVFHRGEGPYPPLHPHCNCQRRQIVSRRLVSGVEALRVSFSRLSSGGRPYYVASRFDH